MIITKYKNKMNGSSRCKTIKHNMNGSGSFGKKISVKTTLDPRKKQLTKRYTKHIVSSALFGVIPYLAYRGIKKVYRSHTPEKQDRRHLAKANKAIVNYDAIMSKPRGKEGSYKEQLVKAAETIRLNANKGEVKKALLIQDYIRSQIVKHEYRATKFIKRYIKKKNLDTKLYESINKYQQNKNKVILSSKNPNYIPDIEKIRYFLNQHKST